MNDDDNSAADFAAVCTVRGDQDLVAMARANGLSEEAARAVASIDAVMHTVRRSIQRREFGRRILAKIDPSLETSHLDAIGAIAHNPGVAGEPVEEVTVGLIAERLGIDPSRASRIAADIVERGYARRVASQQDARRICLELTGKGNRLVDAVRVNKLKLFSRALGQWNEEELVTFARLFERFSTWATDNDGYNRSADAIGEALEQAEAAERARAELADAK